MRYNKSFTVILLLITACSTHSELGGDSSDRVKSLLQQMTWNEKIGQLSMSYVPEVNGKVLQDITEGKVGSVLNGRTSFYSAEVRDSMQRVAIEKSRLGIPLIFGHDVIHGFRTIFPTSLAQSCSWDTSLVRKAARVAAIEAASSGVDWAFSPMVDVARDPRWGRIAECYGEDPFLNSVFGAAVIKGYQGEELGAASPLAACMKHYIGYSASEGGRDYDYTEISDHTIRETYLPPFQVGIASGAKSVMSAFNDLRGIPSTSNGSYINGVLKKELKFDGVVLSDWDAVAQLKNHGIAETDADAAAKALSAGVDVEMKTKTYFQLDSTNMDIRTAVDEAVSRVLAFKEMLGLFDDPYRKKVRMGMDTLARTLARSVAAESMVLLKNDSEVLPISSRASVAVLGDFAQEKELMGWWKSLGSSEDVVTVFEGIRSYGIRATTSVQDRTEAIIACVGEPNNWFGENNNRAYLNLPNEQENWVKSLKQYNKPIVLVVFAGRPLSLSNIVDDVDAIVIAGHPGTEAGNAVAEILLGIKNPSGKLTTSWPRSVGQVPLYYNRRNSGRPNQISYKDQEVTPLFPFGFGLSYTHFKYKQPIGRISEGKLELEVQVENLTSRPGSEIVQVYRRRSNTDRTSPVRSLIAFSKKQLVANETTTFTFTIQDYQNGDLYHCGSSSVELLEVSFVPN